jgi:mannose-6-phosphate isomerase-like protein (cupin superfamily)
MPMSFYPPNRPYPTDRYEGAGEASAQWRPADSPPNLRGGGGSCDYLLTGDQTGGDVGLYRWNMGPSQGGPDPHVHKAISESFFVLEGTITLHDGQRWRPADKGDFVYVPPGGIHGFRNETDAPASMLILFAPGAPREAYFEGLRHIADTGEHPSSEDMAEFFRVHDTYWVSQ